ncbi:MAG: 1-acyl-sn-glycerol-3-phosphate acyltransferase [Telluria sp.]
MSNYQLQPAALATWGQRTSLRILTAFGWRVLYKPLPGPHGVVVVYPHTSNWDFVVGLLGKWSLGLPFRWLGKESLFNGLTGKTLGMFLRRWHGVPVERRTSTGATARLAHMMHESDWFWIALAPEGTRSYRPNWRSGFYHLTLAAKVPLLMVYLDYPNKTISVVDTMNLTGDVESDMAAIAAVYKGHHGLHPELEAPVVLAPPRAASAEAQA